MFKKLEGKTYDTDKAQGNYLNVYEECFGHMVNEKIAMLEIGVFRGGSLLMWNDYFEKGVITGLDCADIKLNDPSGRIKIYKGFQTDIEVLDKIRKERAPDGFDIIIDDASHYGDLTKYTFWYLFENHLKPGGIFVIEDWRTGYWSKWDDGKQYKFKSEDKLRKKIHSMLDKAWSSAETKMKDGFLKKLVVKLIFKVRILISTHKFNNHDYGMVGFVKELVDEMGMDLITLPERKSKVPHRDCKFSKVSYYAGQVLVYKSKKESLKSL